MLTANMESENQAAMITSISSGDRSSAGKTAQQNSVRSTKISKSEENLKEKRQNSVDPNDLSRSEKERKLNECLKRKYKRSRSRRKLTIADVKADTAKILEEFLQEQLKQKAIQTSSPKYQRFVEINVIETTTPSGESSGNFASSSSILREDSIPYADEDEADYKLRKAESLPHDELANFHDVSPSQSLPIHHSKSRSAPYQGGDEQMYNLKRKVPASIKPPPPPPPGTPYSPSENGSSEGSSKLISVPYTGSQQNDSSVRCSSESLDNFYSLERRPSPAKKRSPPKAPESLTVENVHSPSGYSNTPILDGLKTNNGARPKTISDSPLHVRPKVKRSGSVSSSDTEGAGYYHTQGRKKKSVFKKTKERLQHLLKVGKNRPDSADSPDFNIAGSDDQKPKHAKPRKKPKKHGKDKHVDAEDSGITVQPPRVLEDRYIHTNKHIHQTHSRENSDIVIRSEEAMETVDILNNKERKHIEKHTKLKESSGHDGGLMGRFRRLTARDKGKKVKESKSAEFGHDQEDGIHPGTDGVDYSRALSVPGQHQDWVVHGTDETDNAHLRLYNNGGFEFSNLQSDRIDSNTRHISATQVVHRQQNGDNRDIHRNSSFLDIVDHDGTPIERQYFDAEGNQLPRNKSFELKHETYLHERCVDDHGQIKVIRDQGHHEHMEIVEGSAADNKEAEKELEDMTEAEKEELYGKIASRLAAIGDNMMTEKELDQSRGFTTSPRLEKGAHKASPEPDMERTTLTQLEREIRDELREVADGIDARLAGDAQRAALQITGILTYKHFKNIVHESVGNGDGWDQIAAVFHITKKAILLAGASGALAMQIKENSLKYIEDRFASWIVNQGGWDSMLSGTDTDSELD